MLTCDITKHCVLKVEISAKHQLTGLPSRHVGPLR